MKNIEQVFTVIKKIYKEKLNKDPKELIRITIDKDTNFVVLKEDCLSIIPRKYIDDYIDNHEESVAKKQTEFNIIHALKNFQKID
jgi:hypothetical protein